MMGVRFVVVVFLVGGVFVLWCSAVGWCVWFVLVFSVVCCFVCCGLLSVRLSFGLGLLLWWFVFWCVSVGCFGFGLWVLCCWGLLCESCVYVVRV